MENLQQRLDQIVDKISQEDFLQNKGLSNEVGFYVFCYEPKDEMVVRQFVKQLAADTSHGFRVIEKDLYEVFLEICQDKKVLSGVANLEAKKGKNHLLEQLQKVATPDDYIKRMTYEPHLPGDVMVLTGVGKVYPFMRSHNILDNLQHVFPDIPVIMFYPGKYDGQTLNLFGKFIDANYYRAFNFI